MSITVTPTDATLGAFVTDVDLASFSSEEWKEIEDAFHRHAVLIFPDQDISADEQVAFSEHFGSIEFLDGKRVNKSNLVSNATKDGVAAPMIEHRMQILRGNEGWHTDSSYMPLSAKASCLMAIKVPTEGGGTGWADMRAAYDALDEERRTQIQDLSAQHSLYASQARMGHKVDTGMGYGFHTRGAPLRPLVKVHPETGRKALYIGRHAYRIPGMPDEDALALLKELVDFACQPPRIYEHRWKAGDLAIWDNRCVLHRARPYDYREIRVLRHTRIAGDPRTESAPTVADERASGFEAMAS